MAVVDALATTVHDLRGPLPAAPVRLLRDSPKLRFVYAAVEQLRSLAARHFVRSDDWHPIQLHCGMLRFSLQALTYRDTDLCSKRLALRTAKIHARQVMRYVDRSSGSLLPHPVKWNLVRAARTDILVRSLVERSMFALGRYLRRVKHGNSRETTTDYFSGASLGTMAPAYRVAKLDVQSRCFRRLGAKWKGSLDAFDDAVLRARRLTSLVSLISAGAEERANMIEERASVERPEAVRTPPESYEAALGDEAGLDVADTLCQQFLAGRKSTAPHKIVILGAAATGKTSMLRRIAKAAAQAAQTRALCLRRAAHCSSVAESLHPGILVPIFVDGGELGRIIAQRQLTLEEDDLLDCFLQQQYERCPDSIILEVLRAAVENNQTIIIIDGVDQAGASQQIQQVNKWLQKMLELRPGQRLVLSSRLATTDDYCPWTAGGNHYSDFAVYRMLPFGSNLQQHDTHDLLQLGFKQMDLGALRQALGQRPDVVDLMISSGNPLLFSLLRAVVQRLGPKALLSVSPAALYAVGSGVLLGRQAELYALQQSQIHDGAAVVPRGDRDAVCEDRIDQVDERACAEILEFLAYKLHASGTRVASSAELGDIVGVLSTTDAQRSNYLSAASCLKTCIPRGAVPLLVCLGGASQHDNDGYDSSGRAGPGLCSFTFQFAHVSWQEYFAGRHCASTLARAARRQHAVAKAEADVESVTSEAREILGSLFGGPNLPHLLDSYWTQVASFAAGHLCS